MKSTLRQGSKERLPEAKMKLCFILGTRPEIIKLYSVMGAAIAHNDVDPIFIHTGQHYDYEMSQVFLEELNLPKPHYFLNVKSGPHGQQTALLISEIEMSLSSEKPDAAIVLGDTNTTMAGAIAAAKLQIPVVHVEAGCRSFDLNMPEEINRLVVDAISSVFFAPSEVAGLNLLFEGKSEQRVFFAGNTVSDIVEETREARKAIKISSEEIGDFDVVITLHRQENVDNKQRLTSFLKALAKIQGKILFPIHPRTRKRIEDFGLESLVTNIANLNLVKPQNYLTFMRILEEAKVIITDSGGVQEEAMLVGTPCITARDTTEWPETVWSGANYLAGIDAENIPSHCNEILRKAPHQADSKKVARKPYKYAGARIIDILVRLWREESLQIEKPSMADGQYPLPWLLDAKDKSKKITSVSLTFDQDGRARTLAKKGNWKKIARKSQL
jgi:UDP-N-acetylglucosamine 2-epimerase (non-hydrolysing)